MEEEGDRALKVEKPERLLNLLAVFVSSRVPVPFSAIAGKVIGYDDGAEPDALEKRFDRDRLDLRELGVNVEYAQESAEMPAGYFVRKDAVFQRRVTITNDRTGESVTVGASGPTLTSKRGSVGTGHWVLIGSDAQAEFLPFPPGAWLYTGRIADLDSADYTEGFHGRVTDLCAAIS